MVTFYRQPEEAVAAAWEEVLGLPRGTVGRADDFVALGGDSLTAATLASKVRHHRRTPPRGHAAGGHTRPEHCAAPATRAAARHNPHSLVVQRQRGARRCAASAQVRAALPGAAALSAEALLALLTVAAMAAALDPSPAAPSATVSCRVDRLAKKHWTWHQNRSNVKRIHAPRQVSAAGGRTVAQALALARAGDVAGLARLGATACGVARDRQVPRDAHHSCFVF
jgi:hypothetical protein